MKQSYLEYAALFKAFSDETRLKIIDMLSCGEMCACDILEQLSLSQSTLSYHMKILSECGIVNAVRDGAWMRYPVSTVRADEVAAFIRYISKEKEDCICKGSNTCKIEEGEPIGK
ncbi:MAG TPA: metalloregulator ArsR/SmtB family transcription factor [Clostridiaceae bacterium]|nr:metalloregulator ArsR/SmtB family transcription factor [Clostridiaceae bacterium]